MAGKVKQQAKAAPVTATAIKELCRELGAELVGIASPDAFVNAPQGFHPRDILPDCASVIVMARAFPPEILDADFPSYTEARNDIIKKMNSLSQEVAKRIAKMGYSAKSVATVGTKSAEGRNRGPLSLKHAAELAGLGRIGKNTLLVNEHFGNRVWLGATLTAAELEPDVPAAYETCTEECSVCIDACPVSALSGPLMNQSACFSHGFKTVNGALEIQCWKCRRICPQWNGIATGK